MSFIYEHVQHSPPTHYSETVDGWQYQQAPSALEEYRQPPMPSQPLSTPATTPELSYMHPQQTSILQPAPTRRIDTRYLEAGFESPEMNYATVLHTPQQHYRGQPPTWVQTPEYEYVSYDSIQPSHGTYMDYIQVATPVYYGSSSRHVSYESDYPSYPYSTQTACAPQYYLNTASDLHSSTYGMSTRTAPGPQVTIPTSYVPYTPAPSNQGSGSSTPHEEYSMASDYGYKSTETLTTPVTPSTRPVMVPWLLLGQHAVPPPPPSAVQHLHQLHVTPLSPVSPILHEPTRSFNPVEEVTSVAPSAVEVSVLVEEPVPQALSNVSVSTPATMSHAEERLKKLRDRRHVIACTFCRGRKIACHSTPKGDKTDVTPAPTTNDDEYKPVVRGSKRAAAAANKPPCDNCLRRGRECVYPPRAARVSRRRRKEARDQSPFSPDYEE